MENEKKIRVEYFALLSQEAGKSEEEVSTSAATLRELFEELNGRYCFSLSDKQIKASVNQKLASTWESPLSNGDHILFLTPLAGG